MNSVKFVYVKALMIWIHSRIKGNVFAMAESPPPSSTPATVFLIHSPPDPAAVTGLPLPQGFCICCPLCLEHFPQVSAWLVPLVFPGVHPEVTLSARASLKAQSKMKSFSPILGSPYSPLFSSSNYQILSLVFPLL